jgi:protease-4
MSKRAMNEKDETGMKEVRRRSASRLAIGLVLVWLGTGCISIDLLGGGADAPLVETVVRGDEGPKVLLLDIDGIISGADVAPSLLGFRTTSMVARVREVLDTARDDEDVRGILLRIDSPGGTATASEQIYTEILRFKTERNIPVVAQLLTTAASGGYYIAMAADSVQAHPTTVTGSIGVIFSSVNFAGLMEKVGIEDQTITAGEFKDAGSPFRRLTAEERSQLQSIVDDLYARFRDIVVLGRPELDREQVDALANGRIYSAPQALENGLVDEIGTIEDAVGTIERELGVSTSRVVAYHRPREQRRNLYARAMPALPFSTGTGAALGGGGAVNPERLAMIGLEDLLRRPGFHYLWWPGLLSVGAGH